MEGSRLSIPFYVTVGLIAGAIIAYQIGIMRIFSIGTWSHFGSLVVSIAMLGFGVMSAAMCIGTGVFQRHWSLLVSLSLLSFGPLMVLGNTLAQALGFNPITLISDPEMKWKLFQLFVLYFVPFLPGALFLGLAFLRGQAVFGRVYFADLAGSGLCGMVFLVSLYFVRPHWIVMVPVAMWLVAALLWFGSARKWICCILVVIFGALSVWMSGAYQQIDVNQFKGVSYARKFPDSKRIYEAYSPFGYLEVYSSSYFHFAPGLSDNAALNLDRMPKNAYVGMYLDSDGPIGVMKEIEKALTAYFEFLPMYLPFVVKKQPEVFVVQYGGGISTKVAVAAGASKVTVAEGNPLVLRTLRDTDIITKLTGRPLDDKRVTVVPFDGRLYAKGVENKYDIIDLSLADSTGLSNPGGFSIVEKYNYTRETLQDYMRALAPSGVLSITLWNKEDLPKSVPQFFSTAVSAAWAQDGKEAKNKFFIVHTYLSTMTLMYKKDGFSAAEIKTLREYAADMSYEVLYYPGIKIDASIGPTVFKGYRASHFDLPGVEKAKAGEKPKEGDKTGESGGPRAALTWSNLYKVMLHHLMDGEFEKVQKAYVFDTRPLTNNRPYFAGYIKAHEIPNFLDQLEAVSDEWGYLLLWATLIVAAIFGVLLMLFPMIWGWRTIFSRQPGKIGIMVYFMCLGLGYIVVEVGLIAKFIVALGNPTISASVLITGMLLFSGLGSLTSGRYLDRCRKVMPRIFLAIGALLVLGALFFDPILSVIGQWPYILRVGACLLLIAPAAYLMGFPFPMAMAMLSKLGKERFFIWAWGINGTFSVVGAVLVPIVSVLFGHQVLIFGAAAVYIIAMPAFFSVLKPAPAGAAGSAPATA